MEISQHIGVDYNNGELHDALIQMQIEAGLLPISGETYFVSKSGNNTDGSTWTKAYTTIAAAIAASNTHIASSQYSRNRIYIDGGALWAEALTVFPNQCDMIGVGARTGWRPTIYARTNITTAVLGCHIYNIAFNNTTADVPVVKICDASHGIQFYKCVFSRGSVTSTIGLELGSIAEFVVNNCNFVGNPPNPIGILLDGTMAIGEIKNNFISATTTGIQIADGTTSDYGLLIKDNVIGRADPNTVDQLATGILISDTASRCHTFFVHNWISAVDAINFVGGSMQNMDHWLCIDNHIVETTTGGIEDSGS